MDVVGKDKAKLFLFIFWLLLLLNVVALSIQTQWLAFGSKALLMPSLALYLWSSVSRRGLRWARFLLIGLSFAFVGDILLSISSEGTGLPFLLGMTAFLTMHGLLIRHYLRIRDLNNLNTLPNLPIMFLLFAVAVVLMDIITSAAPRSLFFPLIVFGITLATSTGMSAQAYDKLLEPRAYYTIVGALLVMASDILIGLELTRKYLFPGQSVLVMSTYGTGMYLIVRGTLETMKRRKKESGQASYPTGDFEEDLGDFETTDSGDQPQTS